MVAAGQIRAPLAAGRRGKCQIGEKTGDKSMTPPETDQASAVLGDKKDENLHLL